MYIDPGSSSFIIQILIGAAAGIGLAIATFWRRLRLFFAKKLGRGPTTDETTDETTEPPSDTPAEPSPPPATDAPSSTPSTPESPE